MKRIALVLLCLYGFTYGVEYDPIEAEMLSLSCTSCHGTEGKSESFTPSIAGMEKTALYEMLLEYKNGKKTGTMMQKHVKGFSDEELEQIAYYFSNVEK